MRKAVWSGVATAVCFLCFSSSAFAQATANGSVAVTAAVNARAKLTLGVANIDWADADPDTTSEYTADVTVDIKARTSAGSSVTLTMQADDVFDSVEGAVIPFANFTWTVAGANFLPGTVSVAGGTVFTAAGSRTASGTQTLRLVNSWSYATGSYSVILNYTLSAP